MVTAHTPDYEELHWAMIARPVGTFNPDGGQLPEIPPADFPPIFSMAWISSGLLSSGRGVAGPSLGIRSPTCRGARCAAREVSDAQDVVCRSSCLHGGRSLVRSTGGCPG